MGYSRPAGASQSDFQNARTFELQVGEWLGAFKKGNLDATDKLDWYVPGVFIDVKEKRQPLSDRWHLLSGVPETDLMVLDELGIRRAMGHGHSAYFLMRDVPLDRMFLARIDEVLCADRVRRNRNGKGKWIVNLRSFRLLPDGEQLLPMILSDQLGQGWKNSACLGQAEVEQI